MDIEPGEVIDYNKTKIKQSFKSKNKTEHM